MTASTDLARKPVLGCIADDFTGATDLSSMLVRAGARVVQCFGIPADVSELTDADAVVIALKSRSLPQAEAVAKSLEALRVLQELDIPHFFFKYCSTFDSTSQGNIGPVAEALLKATEKQKAIFCPAFPENGRTVYQGHLFVKGMLLHESGMQNHPLNPMTDSSLVRTLSAQSSSEVGLLSLQSIRAGSASLSAQVENQSAKLLIADTIEQADLQQVATVRGDHVLMTGGSAIGGELMKVLLANRIRENYPAALGVCAATEWPVAILSGSCSEATGRQVRRFVELGPVFRIDVVAAAQGKDVVHDAVDWFNQQKHQAAAMISTTANAVELNAIQNQIGSGRAADIAESVLAAIARKLVTLGVRSFIVAGGEMSGAVVQAVGATTVSIGNEICAGVPWVKSCGTPQLNMALKSGNFGDDDFFATALEMLK